MNAFTQIRKGALSLMTALLSTTSLFAMTIEKYDQKKFDASVKEGKKILLHSHAGWCPTCVCQEKSLKALQKDAALNDIIVYQIDFDNDKEALKEWKISSQSVFVAVKGREELSRLSNKTSEAEIKEFLLAAFSKTALKTQLEQQKAQSASKVPEEKRAIMQKSLEDLRKSQIEKKALQLGQKAPDFELTSATGEKVRLSNLLKRGPVVLAFYRGGWCPYCNLQLRDYQSKLPLLQRLGAQLVAISPEKPDVEQKTTAKNDLKFPVLSDTNLQVSEKFGLVFELSPELKKVYADFGIDLKATQGNDQGRLPIPATYLIGKDFTIHFAFVDVDYTKRAEVDDILKAIRERELKARLTPEEYRVTQEAGTERPFQNRYWNHKEEGIYVDIVSGEPLFSSKDKFDSGTGWPSFTRPIQEALVKEKVDESFGMKRIEVVAASGAHLGHVFNDGPKEKGGMRYCINSASLRFVPKAQLAEMGYAEFEPLFRN